MAEELALASEEFDEINDRFRRKFKIAYREIEYLKEKIHLKTGWFIIKSHRYTQQELLESEHCLKIKSNMRKVGNDVSLWHNTGRLAPTEKVLYLNHREELDDRFGDLIQEIETRPPTWWESLKGAFDNFVQTVMRSLPQLEGILAFLAEQMGRLKYVGPVIGVLGTFTGRGVRFIGEQVRGT